LCLCCLQLCHLGPWQPTYAFEGCVHQLITLVRLTRSSLQAVKDLACTQQTTMHIMKAKSCKDRL
jgi:hypothetical protein